MLRKSRLVKMASLSLNLGPVLRPIALSAPILKLRIWGNSENLNCSYLFSGKVLTKSRTGMCSSRRGNNLIMWKNKSGAEISAIKQRKNVSKIIC